jgi:phenylacetate-CoA ligase
MKSSIHKLIRALPDELLFGSSFRKAQSIEKAYLASSDKADFINTYQQAQLEKILSIAAKAPAYKNIRDYKNFADIPFSNKNDMQTDIDRFVVEKKGADLCSTGGTTSGRPLKFYIDKSRKGFEWYWMAKYNWGQIGFKTSDYRAVLRNHKLNGANHHVDHLLKEVQFDNHALKDSYLDYIIDYIVKHDLKFVHAYPSAAFLLAKRIYVTNRETPIVAFLSGSEAVFDNQKNLIQNVLNKRMYTWYGHSEKLILAAETAHCENYHVNPFYGYAEIIDSNGNVVNTPGEWGELVGTGFMNTRMPFVRYRTEDEAEFMGHVCPDCGRAGLTFKNVIGRRGKDVIYKEDGSIITTSSMMLDYGIYQYIKGVQYYQQKKGELIIRIVPQKDYDASTREKVLDIMRPRFRDGLKIELVEVESLEYTKNNKLKLLIQDTEPAL